MRLFLAAAVAGWLGLTGMAYASERERSVRDRYIAAIQAQVPEVQVQIIDDLAFELRVPGSSEPLRANADNLIRELDAGAGPEQPLIARYARVAVAALNPPPSARSDQIVSVVRTRAWVQSYETQLSGATLPTRSLLGDLVEVLAFNEPEAFRYGDVASMGKIGPLADLWRLGRAQARAQLGRIQRDDAGSGVTIVSAPDSALATSLILDSKWCDQKPVPYTLVSDKLLLTFLPATPETLDSMRSFVADGFDDYRLSTTILTCHAGQLAAAN